MVKRNRFKYNGKLFPELTQFEASILEALLADSGRPKYGFEVGKLIEESSTSQDETTPRRKATVRVGRFYENLDRLFNDLHLVEPAHEEEGPNGTTRRYWKINALGEMTLAANADWWRRRVRKPTRKPAMSI